MTGNYSKWNLSKKTPGEKNPKILKSGLDWAKVLGPGWLDR